MLLYMAFCFFICLILNVAFEKKINNYLLTLNYKNIFFKKMKAIVSFPIIFSFLFWICLAIHFLMKIFIN